MTPSDFASRTWVFVDLDGIADHTEIARIAPGLQAQLREDLGPEWGLGNLDTVLPTVTTSEFALELVQCQIQWHAHAPADQQGAIAIHGIDANGNPIAHFYDDIAKQCSVSPSSCISHELAEASVDPTCDREATLPDGRVVAVEVADQVEALTYDKGGVDVSDFNTKSNFGIDGNEPPYDFLGKQPSQFEVLDGGYAQVRTADGWQQLSPAMRCRIGDCVAPAERRIGVCADHRHLATGMAAYLAEVDRRNLSRGARRRRKP